MKVITLILVSSVAGRILPTLNVTEIKAYNEANPVIEPIKATLAWPMGCMEHLEATISLTIDDEAAAGNAGIGPLAVPGYDISLGYGGSAVEPSLFTDARAIREKKIKALYYSAMKPITLDEKLEIPFQYVAQDLAKEASAETTFSFFFECENSQSKDGKFEFGTGAPSIKVNSATTHSALFAIALISPLVSSL
ncbi:hypothetical protein DSO57_1013512 [Entomophthora muscae]|uniref:Uncharacterized protein n=1 Tax=Entomophthora muscae TaxID=34485 RepID=A0ACC2TGI5_9FUNG|nr:hypothetical protein DSO57_1013512 [Entomophthora muscae]